MVKKLWPEILVLVFVLLGTFLRVYRLVELPPGLFWDEAYDGFDALRVLQTGVWPVFFSGNNGREPLTIFLQAIGIAFLGAQVWVLRLVPAGLGVITIAVVYRVARELFYGDKRAAWLGALAAGIMAISFWHVDVSRLSLRVISFPLLSGLAVWFFWRAWNRARFVDFGLSGIFLGVVLYTYLAARLLPFILLGFIGLVALTQALRRNSRQNLDWRRLSAGLGLMLAAMVVVFIPFGLYFLANPGAFLLRTSYISILSNDPTGDAVSLAENAVRVARMFVDRGDLEWRHNLSGRPALDVLGLIGFWTGLVIAVWNWAKPRYLFLLVWMGANLLSTLLSTEAPHFLRSIGALPAIVILAADGLMQIWGRVLSRWGWRPLLVGVVAFGGVLTYHDYFDVWATRRDTWDAFNGPVVTIAQRALALSQTSNVVLPLRIFGTPNMQFYLAGRFPHGIPYTSLDRNGPATWIAAGGVDRSVIVLTPAGIFVPAPLDDQGIARLREMAKSGQPIKGSAGQTLAMEWPVADLGAFISDLRPEHTLDANFGGEVRMIGYDLDPTTVKPGDRVRITYYWQALIDVTSDYFVTSNLLDPFGQAYGQTILEPVSGKYPTSLWQRGAIVPDTFVVQVPNEAHAGKYRMEVGLLDRIAFDRLLPLRGAQDRLFLDPIVVTNGPVNPNRVAHPLTARFGDPSWTTLIGYDLSQSPFHAGETVHLTLYWRAEQAAPRDYSLFVHLYDAQGRLKAQQDSQPENGNAPTSWWQPGDLLDDPHDLTLPAGLPAGTYHLAVGMYEPASGGRLPLLDGSGTRQPDDSWQIPIQVMAP